jgi:hypothetical protein
VHLAKCDDTGDNRRKKYRRQDTTLERETVAAAPSIAPLDIGREKSMTFSVRSVVWLVVYLLFVLLPLFALLAGSLPPARGFWTEFSAALGYSGLAIMGLQFGLHGALQDCH